MSGYRMRRKTRGANYIAANSSLTLPWAYSNSVDDGTHGVFPEFFYNFSNTSGFNADLGIVFRGNNGWHIFAYGNGTIDGYEGWYDKKISLSPGATIDCAVYTENNKLILKVNGTAYSIPIVTDAITKLKKGCVVSREANLVPQMSISQMTPCTLLKTNAYFTGAAWSNTTLTTTSSTYVKMDSGNTLFYTELDKNDPTVVDSGCLSHLVSTVNGYVKDECSIDFRKRICCLK